ncbi:hypothetical protein [Streptomyces sp. NPDC048665]|uniref:hypothetical protein n=1 Tax=Streptomyces sp. NPDC048665 TaxID=3155490 RepID=UPI0034173678
MFEIRIICDPADTDHVVATLDNTFDTGTVTVYPSRDRKKNRLYVRASHKHAPETSTTEWPTPGQAYATAPDVHSELRWLCNRELSRRDRTWWLRRAALTDRIAAGLTPVGTATEEQAHDLAVRLMDLDDTAPLCDPRAYVRQQYARWAKANDQ